MIKAVLLDCDGTLLDTAADLTQTTNHIRKVNGYAPVPLSLTRPIAGDGARALLNSANDIPENQLDKLVEQFFNHYKDNIFKETTQFDGMDHLISTLSKQSITWGIVTNRPTSMTHSLLAHFNFNTAPACIVCGDTLAQSKPHPAPVLHACDLIQTDPEHCLYVGDNIRDIQAGNAAGAITVAAAYGYLNEQDDPNHWNADHVIRHPAEILTLIR